MPTTEVYIPYRTDGPRMTYVTSDGASGDMHRASSQFEFRSVAKIETVERQGQKDISITGSAGLQELRFSQVLGQTDYTKSIEPLVAKLALPAQRGLRIRFNGGSPAFENGKWWLIQDLAVKTARRALNNSASRVVLDWQLVEYSPVAASAYNPAPLPTTARSTTGAAAAPVARYHRVVAGDTLYTIAARYLGNGARWPEIQRLNATVLRNPDIVPVGANLKIPGK